uniref:Uncharacterized protein n=1 Tax=Timema monikensis TaxID=170555 RepID=A0A7R9HMT7_9NEOP|nr:unnamed protein product [Timema monikensis]
MRRHDAAPASTAFYAPSPTARLYSSLFLDFWLQELHSYFDMFQCTSGINLRSDEKERTQNEIYG